MGYIKNIFSNHMYKFSQKQKKILVMILCIVIIAILYYIYTNKTATFISTEEMGEETTEENQIDENTEEQKKKIIVHISGAVNKEGIVELDEDSRISDAVDKAGGLKENADIKQINLAFKLEDGMKIYIPSVGEETLNNTENSEISEMNETSKYVTSSSGGALQTENEKQENENSVKKVNINTATQTELETLPGIGPSTSLKIINYRKENGNFKSIEDIKEVSGIGSAKYEKIKELICVK